MELIGSPPDITMQDFPEVDKHTCGWHFSEDVEFTAPSVRKSVNPLIQFIFKDGQGPC